MTKVRYSRQKLQTGAQTLRSRNMTYRTTDEEYTRITKVASLNHVTYGYLFERAINAYLKFLETRGNKIPGVKS